MCRHVRVFQSVVKAITHVLPLLVPSRWYNAILIFLPKFLGLFAPVYLDRRNTFIAWGFDAVPLLLPRATRSEEKLLGFRIKFVDADLIAWTLFPNEKRLRACIKAHFSLRNDKTFRFVTLVFYFLYIKIG